MQMATKQACFRRKQSKCFHKYVRQASQKVQKKSRFLSVLNVSLISIEYERIVTSIFDIPLYACDFVWAFVC